MAENCAQVRLRRSALLQIMKICASDNVLQVYVGALYELHIVGAFRKAKFRATACSLSYRELIT